MVYKNSSKRGCTPNPDDGVTLGISQSKAGSNIVPSGYTNIKQFSQRATTSKGNNYRATTLSIGSSMECYDCEVEMTAMKPGLNAIEPIYDMIKDQDTASCWQVQHDVTAGGLSGDRVQTASSGQCHGNCFVSAYKYKIMKNQMTTFKWFLKRGCARSSSDPTVTGSEFSKDIFGLKITNTVCDFQNGTLCNDQLNKAGCQIDALITTTDQLQRPESRHTF